MNTRVITKDTINPRILSVLYYFLVYTARLSNNHKMNVSRIVDRRTCIFTHDSLPSKNISK